MVTLGEKTYLQALSANWLRIHRRGALQFGALITLSTFLTAHAKQISTPASMSDWMDVWISERSRLSPAERELNGGLYVGRFKDPIYFLTKTIAWLPNADQIRYQRVDVPVGFVTDFASIPRAFWSALRPDGDYAYAAVVHDFLYWTQQRPRDEADEIFNLAMQDLKIETLTRMTIFQAVRRFGASAWSANARLKAGGEKRVLREFPQNPTVTWEQWKQVPNAF